MAVDASSYRSAVNSSSQAILRQGSGHFEMALSLCVCDGVALCESWMCWHQSLSLRGSCNNINREVLLIRALDRWEYFMLCIIFVPAALSPILPPLWSLPFLLLVLTCSINGSCFALCFWKVPSSDIIMRITNEKYPGHYCAGCSSFDFDSSFGLAQQTIHHWAISLSLFLVFHCVPALSFIYTLFFPH